MKDLLVFDTEHFNVTGVYTMTDQSGNSYSFSDALETKDFVDNYYKNPICAMYAYNVVGA